MKKYAAKDPFTSSTYGKKIDYGAGVKKHSSGSNSHIQANDVRSAPGWDKPLSKKLTF